MISKNIYKTKQKYVYENRAGKFAPPLLSKNSTFTKQTGKLTRYIHKYISYDGSIFIYFLQITLSGDLGDKGKQGEIGIFFLLRFIQATEIYISDGKKY